MNTWVSWNPNPVNARVGDCAQRAIAAALGVNWDTASDLIYDMAKAMGTTTHDDAAWGAVLRRFGFTREVIPNTCPDCYTVRDFCEDNPRGVYVLKMSGHVATVIDGHVYDTWDSSGEIPTYYWHRREK